MGAGKEPSHKDYDVKPLADPLPERKLREEVKEAERKWDKAFNGNQCR